jgi:hypothetical protein
MAKATVETIVDSNFYNKLNSQLESKKKPIFWFILGIGFLLALLSFNARITEAHDDALYIEAGYKYVHEFPNYYYTSNAPMYPMFLALLTLVFGTNLIVFKLFSILFFVLGATIFYKALDKKVPEILKLVAFSFLCINYLVLYFASQTFSEPFYLLVQSIFLFYFSKYNFSENPISTDIKKDLKKWVTLGLLMMILTLAKNILVFGIVAIFLFYVLKKAYKKAVFAMVSFGAFKVLYEIIKSAIWGKSAIQYQSQMGILLNKDPYDASQGTEDMAGFFGRFFDNCNLYISKRFFQLLGFMNDDSTKVFGFFAFVIIVLVLIGLYLAIKKNNDMITFMVLFAGTICFGTFFVLQARWDQPRFIMVHMPAILIGIFFGLYTLFSKNTFNQRILVLFICFIMGSMLLSSAKRAVKNLPIVSKNLKGDVYFGYTPDWKNYLELSAYCKDSLPEKSFVACRKAPMSFVYAKGKHFFPIYNVIAKDPETHQSNPDSAIAIFKKNNVTHLLIASLRLNPKQNTGDVINTLHNIAAPIMQKYPEKLVMVKQMGVTEAAYLYEIKY